MRLAVIVPVHAAPEMLTDCLRALGASTRPPDEIIVVDDGSPDQSAIERAFHAQLLPQVTRSLIRQAQAGPAAARNRGARQATADVLVFVDADVAVHADALQRIAAAFEDATLDGVAGSYDNQPSAQTLVSDYRNLLHHYIHQKSRRQASTFWAGLGAIRRDAFAAAGGFDESFAQPSIEDVEFGLRLTASGHRLALDPAIQGTHAKRWTLRSFFLTDLRQRAIPWMRLWLERADALPRDLNFGLAQRLSVALVLPTLLSLLFAFRLPWLGLAAGLAGWLTLAALHAPFLLFLARSRGVGFALGALPLHLLHLLASALGALAGAAQWAHRRDPHLAKAAALLATAVLAWQLASGAHSSDFGGYPDEASHYVTGVMIAEYLRHPTWPPMAFAERYYLYYPKVALGHWPPVLYIVEGIWFHAFGASRTSALLLQAVCLWLVLLAVYVLARRVASFAVTMAVLFLLMLTLPFQGSLGWVMADALGALTVLAAALAFVAYLARPGWLSGQLFGLLAALALLTKGSACPLALLPALALVGTRRWHLLRRADLWLSALPVLLLAAPWYLFAIRFNSPNNVAFTYGQPNLFAPWLEYGPVLIALAVAGAWLAPRRDPVFISLTALLASFAITPFAVRAFQEGRHLLPAMAAAAVLAAVALARAPRPAPAFAIAAALGLSLNATRIILWHPPAQFRPWAASRPAGPILISGSPNSEGALVAALAEREPAPRDPVFRASRVLASSSWGGHAYKLLVKDPAAAQAKISELGVATVIQAAGPRLPHDDLLDVATGGWPSQQRDGVRIARNPSPVAVESYALRQSRLGRVLRSGARE